MAVKQVQDLAEGQVFTGEQALEHGLIDKLGGYIDAVSAAHELASISQASCCSLCCCLLAVIVSVMR